VTSPARILRSICFGLLLFVAAGPVSAQPKQLLTLTVEVLRQRYCAAGADAASLETKLKLRYVNSGNEKLILYKGHDLFYQTRIRSVPKHEDTRPYEITFLNSRYFDEEFEAIDEPAPSRVFVILDPGATFERELVVGIGVVGDGANQGAASVKAGSHTLQLIVSTWYKTISLAQKLRERWKQKGYLWFQPLRTNPVALNIEVPKSLPQCK
jgi:hypothetical protein